MTPVRAPQARTPPIRLSELDERIIRAAGLYGYVTIPDFVHLLAPVSFSTLRERARRLAGNADHVAGQYLLRFPLASPKKGTKARVYTPGVKGRQFLGLEGYYRPSKIPSYHHLWHALTLTRFCVGAAAFGRTNPSFTLAEMRLSYEVAGSPPRVTIPINGQDATVAVIPDAWLLFVRSDGKKFPLLVEIDRSSEYRMKFQSLVRRRLDLILLGEYTRYFGEEAVCIVFATTGGATRLSTMQRWTQDVINAEIDEQTNRQEWLERFYFTSIVYEELFAPALFTDPVWQHPGTANPVPLLPPIPANKTETRDGDIAQTTGTGEVPAALCDQTGLSADAAE
jgi:hypothetical protein